jgi:CO/xanthine dehydrogenase Mo-binding subunit
MTAEKKEYRWIGKRVVRPDGVEKVTGRAQFSADFNMPGQIVGKVLRSPHAHALIKSIDTSKATALPGVKAIVIGSDFPELPDEWFGAGRVENNFSLLSQNVIARTKVLYEGHAIGAVAATTSEIADEALSLIKVDYEILPHVIDVEDAIKPDAPLLFEDMITRNVTPPPTKPSNIAKIAEFHLGDIEKGFAEADVIVEREFTTKAVHQGYIEPHACIASCSADGQATIWSSSQGHFQVRAWVAKIVGMAMSKINVMPAEIGGGFGGKLIPYLEPVAVALSRKSGRAVKIVMTREEVFRASGPTSGSHMRVKMGAKKDGTIIAVDGEFMFQAGAFPGSPVVGAAMCAFAQYTIPNVKSVGIDVVTNRPKVAAYRAPGAPISAFATESIIDELAQKLGVNPLEMRIKNGVRQGDKAFFGPTFGAIAFVETLEALRDHPNNKVALGANQGRGFASGYWFNGGGESTATVNINGDGTASVIEGNPDIGGSRASMALMTAEVLGIEYGQVKAIVGDTASIGFNHVTGGSRVTFATGMAVVRAAEDAVREMRERAAMIWDISPDAVDWVDGYARPAGPNAGNFEPLSLKQIAGISAKTGGPITGHCSLNAEAPAPGLASMMVDVEVDTETGHVTVLRATLAQDVGRAIHPSYVEGQMQGGVAQGIGWALNEEYIYDKNGRLENPGFLDYRIPVCSDLPMLDTVMIECPHPGHPFGVKGVGEVPIVPPMAAVANAIQNAIGVRMTSLPMSPPKIVAALELKKA